MQINSQDQARRGALRPGAMTAGVGSVNLPEEQAGGPARGAKPPFRSPEAKLFQITLETQSKNNHQEEKLPRRPQRDKLGDKSQVSWGG